MVDGVSGAPVAATTVGSSEETAITDAAGRFSVKLTVMDGVEIHNSYRLFGLVGGFNPETVARFELTAGGFGARYGDRLSSLLKSWTTGPESATSPDQFRASVTDANVVFEGTAPGGGSWLLSGRRT